jgi:trk system potassium uptake protein TrkA
MKRFVIVGLGNFGSSVAEALYRDGHDVIALDVREEAVDAAAPHVSRAAVGDGQETDTLRQVGAAEADAAVISTGDNLTASLLSVLALRDLGVTEIYVKVISGDHARIMDRLDVTETVFPERESGFNLASRISDRSVINYVHLAGDLSIQEMVVPEAWRGQTLRDLSVRDEHRVSVIAIRAPDADAMSIPPDPDAPLRASHTLVLAGTRDDLEHLTST